MYPPQITPINVDSPTRATKMMDKWQTMILERQAYMSLSKGSQPFKAYINVDSLSIYTSCVLGYTPFVLIKVITSKKKQKTITLSTGSQPFKSPPISYFALNDLRFLPHQPIRQSPIILIFLLV